MSYKMISFYGYSGCIPLENSWKLLCKKWWILINFGQLSSQQRDPKPKSYVIGGAHHWHKALNNESNENQKL